MSGERARYVTLQDYLRVIRRHKLLIALITIAFVLLALGRSISQPTVYTTSAEVNFSDPLQDLTIVGEGGQVLPDVSPQQRASINADLVTRPETTERVRKRLDTDVPAASLAAGVSTSVDLQTNLVLITAAWGDPQFAADLANAYAEEAKRTGVDAAKDRLRRAQDSLLASLEAARDQTPVNGIRVSILEQNLARARSLLTIIDPVQIAREAQVPSAPSSPQVARDTVLGGFVGLILALIAAFVRDAFDRRLHNAQEVHEELAMPIVGRIAETAFSHSGLVANGRLPMIEHDFEAFRVLRMNLAYLGGEAPLRSVLVTSALPQEGKSSVSIALASAAALAGQRVLLVECDLRRPSFEHRMGISRAPGLTDYLLGNAQPRDILQVVEIAEPGRVNGAGPAQGGGSAGSFVVIPAGIPVPTSPELLQTERFRTFIEKITRAYDLVILDGSPLLSVADPLELAPVVEGVLVCVRVQQTTRDQVRAARAALSHLPGRPSGAVVTGLRRGDETYEYYYGY